MKQEYISEKVARRIDEYNHVRAIQRNAYILIGFFALMVILAIVSTALYARSQQDLQSTQMQLRAESAKASEFEDWYNRTCQGEPITDNGACTK